MPDYNNYALPVTPSKSHNIYVLALYDVNTQIFNNCMMSLGSTVNNKSGKFISAYIFDLYKLANLVTTSATPNKFGAKVVPVTEPWKRIFCKSYNDSPGTNVYTPLKNFLPMTVDNNPNFSAHVSNVNLTFSPLVNIAATDINSIIAVAQPGIYEQINDQAAAERVIYMASRIPLYPLLFSSSIAAHATYGPVFMNRLTFRVNGGNSIGNVEIEATFQGGKCIVSPDLNALQKRKPNIEPIIYNQMKDLNDVNISEKAKIGNYVFDYHRYRSASLIDIIVFEGYKTSYADLVLTLNQNLLSPPAYKITSVNLIIDQNFNITHTNPYEYVGYNNIVWKGDRYGPKFISLESRRVSGEIQYFSYNKTLELDTTSGLTLYFGGPFFYGMKYVDWENPSVTISPNGGYIHTYAFKARLPEDVFFATSDLSKTVSEFSEPSAFNLDDYIKSVANTLLRGINW